MITDVPTPSLAQALTPTAAPTVTSTPTTPTEPNKPLPPRLTIGDQILTLMGIIIPFMGVIAAGVMMWGWGFNWTDLLLMVGMYVISAGGITVGYHRLFVHRSFEARNWVKVILGICGSMALQGNLLKWVAVHRRHHQHSDTEDDVHSPHTSGTGWRGLIFGFWHSHVGWVFYPTPSNLEHYVKDLNNNRSILTVDRLFPLWVVLGFVIPTVLGGLIAGSWYGALSGLVWGGLVRVFLVHHVTASVNSACHLWGATPFHSDDHSKNNIVFGVLALGEGWHNTHHAFPTSARHGLRWWELDISYWIIRTLAFLGLAWNIKLPTPEMQRQKSKYL